MKILCIEDGSVSEETLQQIIENPESLDNKVLIYRQGAKPPYVLEI